MTLLDISGIIYVLLFANSISLLAACCTFFWHHKQNKTFKENQFNGHAVCY